MLFIWLFVLATVLLSDSGDSTLLMLSVAIRTNNEIGATELDLLRGETERLFSPAGLRVRWLPDEEAEALVRVVITRRPTEPVVYGCSRGLHDHRLAVARPRSREITLWTEQVARAATGIWDVRKVPRASEPELGRALGRTLAHELGHVLLGALGHERKGLMRAAFKHRELSSPAVSSLAFSSEERLRLRAAVAELARAYEESAGIKSQR